MDGVQEKQLSPFLIDPDRASCHTHSPNVSVEAVIRLYLAQYLPSQAEGAIRSYLVISQQLWAWTDSVSEDITRIIQSAIATSFAACAFIPSTACG